ncbi:phage scaffolding protein [Lachnospiraceae bacterium SGI.085]
MKREELEALGLTKEQIDGTLDMYHKEHDPVQKELDTVKADLTAEQEKVKTHEGTIEGLKKDLEEFKDADVSGMKQKIEDLEKDIKAKEADYQRQIADRDFDDVLKDSINAAHGKNAKAIKALLDVETLKASKNQKEDVAAAIKALSEAEDSKMLFGEAEPNPTGKGDPIGGVGGTGTKPQADSLMSALEEKYKSK